MTKDTHQVLSTTFLLLAIVLFGPFYFFHGGYSSAYLKHARSQYSCYGVALNGPSKELLLTNRSHVEEWSDDRHNYLKRNNMVHAVRKDLNITSRPSYYGNYSVRIVYFVNCKINPNYASWINGQMAYLPLQDGESKFRISELYIVASALNCSDELNLQSAVNALSVRLAASVRIVLECHSDPHETFEYHGIQKAWQLGQLFPDQNDIVFYFHSKGLTHTTHYLTPGFTKPLLEGIGRVEEAFNLFPTIDKMGFQSGGIGWIWYNFWYARGSYLKKVERPLLTTRRHYYEDWLSRAYGPFGPLAQSPEASETPLSSYPNSLIGCYALGYENLTEYPNVGVILDPITGDSIPF